MKSAKFTDRTKMVTQTNESICTEIMCLIYVVSFFTCVSLVIRDILQAKFRRKVMYKYVL